MAPHDVLVGVIPVSLTQFVRLAGCVLCSSFVLASPTASYTPQRQDFFGMVTHYWGDVMPQKMRELGAGWIRAGCRWADVQPTPDPDSSTWDWNCPDQIMGAVDQGFRVLYGLGYAPPWANGGNADSVPPTTQHMGDWYYYCAELMRRYRGRRVVYEVWNEPNLDLFFGGGFDDYVDLVRYASQALRATDPSAWLSGPETSNLSSPGRETWHRDAVRRLAGMLDVVTTHWYCGSHCGSVADTRTALSAYMTTTAADVSSGVPVWLTETGLQTPDDNRQAEFYDGVLSAYAENSEQAGRRPAAWQNVFFYHLLADDDNTLIRTDASRLSRPAFYRYRWWILGRPYAVPRTGR